MKKQKLNTASRLAQLHYQVEPGMQKIFVLLGRAEDDSHEPVKLLEVNEATIAAGILPLGFGPDPANGIDFSSVIVEVTPDEFEQIERGELPLPNGWVLGDFLPPATVAVSSST